MNWYNGSIVEAVNLSKSRGAVFVVYVEGKDQTSTEMSELLNKPEVHSRLNVADNFVTIKLESGSQAYTQFAQIYQFVPVPSIFFIGGNGTPLEIIAGSTTGGLTGLCSRIDAVLSKKDAESSSGSQVKIDSPSSSKTGSSSFIAAEQKQATMNTSASATKANTDNKDYDLVCEGEVCVRRPKQTVLQPSPDGDGSSTSTSNITAPPPSDPVPAAQSVQTPTPSSGETAQSSTSNVEESQQVPLDDKVERAKELIEMKKREKQEEEKRQEREKELSRRAQGQGVAELKRWQHEQELKNLQEERKRERKENEKARQRILDQIAQDRADRQARYAHTEPPKPASPTTPQPPTPIADTSNITRIQFKMPDGSAHVTQFESDSKLGQLRDYVRKNLQTSGNFTISTIYPRRFLLLDEDGKTLRDLGLSPSSALLILKGENIANVVIGNDAPYPVARSSGFFGLISHIFWTIIVAPVQGLYTYISNLITGRRPPTESNKDSQPSTSSSSQVRRPQAHFESNIKRRKLSGGESDSKGVRREGNTYRLRDPRDSDDENNTWNGNSTQQM